METEYEATFSNIDKNTIREKIKSLGGKLIKPEILMRRFTFNLNPNQRGKWARVRDEGDKITMSFKAIEGFGIESQKEVEIEVDDFNSAVQFLKACGLIKKAYQENYREIWKIDDVELMIDEWPFLEPYLEIEGLNEQSVKKIAEDLGFDYTKAIFSSTDEQYIAKYGVSEDKVVNHTPEIKFNMDNPFLT